MGFFDQSNTSVETIWFSVLAAISLVCFRFGIWMGRRSPILASKLVPFTCLLLAYENIVLALSNLISTESALVKVGRTTRAAVIPLFLVIMFEVAYAVHKRRSVKFCGIVFDQGHRRGVEPCSWVLRNFVRIVAVLLFAVGILVNYDVVGNDDKAGGTGLADTKDASAHLLLALLPTTGMAAIALYIAVYMWKYGNDASIVVQSTVCNGWMFLFLGTLALLGGQVPPEWCFRVVNETGQVLLLLSLIAIGREIGREVQAADNFSYFLEKENELEIVGGDKTVGSSAARGDDDGVPPRLPAANEFGRGAERAGGVSPSSLTREEREEKRGGQDDEGRRIGGVQFPAVAEWAQNTSAAVMGDIEVEEKGQEIFHVTDGGNGSAGRSIDDVTRPVPRQEPGVETWGLDAGREKGSRGAGRSMIDDVTRPMPRQEPGVETWGLDAGVEKGSRGAGRLSSILQHKKGPTLLEDSGGGTSFSGLTEDSEGASEQGHTRRDTNDENAGRG